MIRVRNNHIKLGKDLIPLFSNIINFGTRFKILASKIDKLKKNNTEWDKINLLKKDLSYLAFIQSLTGEKHQKILMYLNDFKKNKNFKKKFKLKLKKLNNHNKKTDDLRFHAITLYILVRSIKPRLFVETGISAGKSSALILLALKHNKFGNLISIDLPEGDKKRLKYSKESMKVKNEEIGILVPEYLKLKWKIIFGDSIIVLKKLFKNNKPNIFLHDSLHTYDHTKKEINIILGKKSKKILVLCDNIEMGSGKAFNQVLIKRNTIGYAYKNFAGVNL